MARYDSTRNQMVRGDNVTLFPSAARAASANGAAVNSHEYGTAVLVLDVTAVSGTTPSLTVTVETSHDGTTWVSAGAFAAITAVGSERKAFSGLRDFVRGVAAISGTTPSFTFSVEGALK